MICMEQIMHRIPDSLKIGGFKYDLKPLEKDGDGPYVDMANSIIYYDDTGSNDHTVSEILGQVLRVMLDMNGLLPAGRSKKISADYAQLLKCLQNYMFTFLRDNPIDWRMVALNVQLLEERPPQKFAMPPVEDIIIDDGAVEGPSLDETATEAIDAIGNFDYEPAPDSIQDTRV